MTSIIISGRPNSEEMSECILVAKNIANMYPSSRFTIVLKSPKEWEKYCEDLCNLFGILKKTHPLILFSNGNKIGGSQEFFKLISESFKYDKLIKKNNEYFLDIDPSEITKLTRENTLIVEKEYFCRTKGKTVLDKINDKLDQITVENFSNYYKKYNTIEIDYSPEYIEDMKVYVKYSDKFTPDPKDYIDYNDIIEQRPAYVDKEKYKEYHEELKERIELEKRLRKEAEEEAKRKAEEEMKAKEEVNKGEEENKETDESNGNKKKDKKKKKEEEERKRKEEERKKKEEEEKRKKEEEKRKEEEERKKKEEEEKKKKEEEKELNGEMPQIKTESGKEEELPQQEEQKIIKYKRIYFKCYSDFDIPYDKYDKELIVETFKEENFQLLINPCFTFFGETLINNIKDYEAPLLPEREEPIIEEEEEENPQMISPITENTQTQNQKGDKKENKKNKEKEDQINTNLSNTNNANNANPNIDKKFSPMNTATSNMSGKVGDKKEKGKEKEKENNQNQQKVQTIENQECNYDKDCKIGGPTKSTKMNTYKPNCLNEKDELIIKDWGRLPSLRILEFDGDDLQFYKDYIPPYQLKEHIFNNTNLFNFSTEKDLIDKGLLMNIIQIINETDGYATYKVLPYNFTDWKKFSTNKVRILPNKCKDIKNNEYPLVDKLNQQINKYKRSLFEGNIKENDDVKNFELILHNEDFEQCFTLPEFFTLDIFKKNKIPHLIKTFSQGTFIYINLLYAINKMSELLDINNQTGYGYCLIICKKFVFLAPIKEPYIYTKGIDEKKDNKEKGENKEKEEEKKEENKENPENKKNEEKKGEEEKKEEEEKKKEEKEDEMKNKKLGQRIPIFIEPYYFLGIYTLPYIESEWPESIERKNVKFDLIEILKKSTN